MSERHARPWRTVARAAAGLSVVAAAGCIIIRHAAIRPLSPRAADAVTVRSPVKAHLRDGTTVTYPSGFELAQGVIYGSAHRVDLALHEMPAPAALPLDSVIGMESYSVDVNVPATVALSTGATIVTVAATGALLKALFGSCPTFYSDSAGVARLEAEGFSYSIAERFEGRDVDRLRAEPSPDGTLRLEVRNEAYETHYINHLQLLEITHAPGELIVPDAAGGIVAVRDLAPPRRAVDRAGRDLTAVLAASDGIVAQTDSTVLWRADEHDFDDFVDLTVPVPAGADSVALVFRMRNSLLNTVLLYDGMLGQGARSLDWLGRTMRQILPALLLGRWYVRTMGMHVSVADRGAWREVARVPDTGPIAWKDVAVVMPAPSADSLRVRLSYVADNWRIDRVAIGAARRVAPRVWPLAEVIGSDGRPDSAARANLLAADRRYLETFPHQRFEVVWRPGPAGPGEARTFLLASQGYYTEWIRPGWIAAPRDTTPFRPSAAAMAAALRRWRAEQHAMDSLFAATRLPVR